MLLELGSLEAVVSCVYFISWSVEAGLSLSQLVSRSWVESVAAGQPELG